MNELKETLRKGLEPILTERQQMREDIECLVRMCVEGYNIDDEVKIKEIAKRYDIEV